MNKVWVIGDLHFGHKKAAEFRGFTTLVDHDAILAAMWNAVVRPKDTVWVLGDVAFGNKEESLKILSTMHGDKRLVLGNHDQADSSLYLKYFTRLYACAVVKNVLLTHMPVHPNQLDRFGFNVHGHMHYQSVEGEYAYRYFCASAERVNLTPILLDDVVYKLHSSSM